MLRKIMPKLNDKCRILDYIDYKIVFKCRISPEWFMVISSLITQWKEIIFYSTNSARLNVFLIVKEDNNYIITSPNEEKKNQNE